MAAMNVSNTTAYSNATMEEDEVSKRFLEDSRYWIQKALLPCVVLIGLVGNIVSIIVLTRKRMRSSTNVYLTALAVSDILILIFHLYLSFENDRIVREPEFILYWEYRRFALWLDDAALGISVWLTVTFTCERYVAVCHPLKGKVFCTESRAKKIIAAIFIICPLSLITTPFEHRVEVQVNNDTKRNMSASQPSELGNNPLYKTVFYWFITIVYVLVPLIILAILNSLLINAVRRSRRRRSTLTQAKYHSSFKQRQENKITMTLVAVVFLFLVCQTPQTVVMVINISYIPDRGTRIYNLIRVAGNVSNFLLAVNAASNFIMYCVMSDQYRRTLVLTFFPAYYKRRLEQEAALRSDASFRLTSFRQSSFRHSTSIRSDQRNIHSKSERKPSSETNQTTLPDSNKETPDSISLIKTGERRVSLSPYS